MALKPLPPPQLPIVSVNQGGQDQNSSASFGQVGTNQATNPATAGAPTQQFAEYLQALDKTVRGGLSTAPNTQTASYALTLTDAAGVVEINAAGANNLTVPLNNTVPFPIGTRIMAIQIGAGTTTIVATGGVTIRSRLGLISAGQYAVMNLYKRGADDWILYGDLT